jgi:glutamate synthase (NADPH/NADH) large chain
MNWDAALSSFVKVMPMDYKRVLAAARRAEERGEPVLDAIMAAAHG